MLSMLSYIHLTFMVLSQTSGYITMIHQHRKKRRFDQAALPMLKNLVQRPSRETHLEQTSVLKVLPQPGRKVRPPVCDS